MSAAPALAELEGELRNLAPTGSLASEESSRNRSGGFTINFIGIDWGSLYIYNYIFLYNYIYIYIICIVIYIYNYIYIYVDLGNY